MYENDNLFTFKSHLSNNRWLARIYNIRALLVRALMNSTSVAKFLQWYHTID